jgi:hypothetical protein
MNARARWWGLDVAVALAVTIAVVLSPDALCLIAYHL